MVENISIEDGMEQEETFGFKPNMYGKDLTRVIKILFEKHVLEECFNKELEHEISHHLSQSEMRELMDHLKSSHQRCIDQVVRAAMKYMKMLIFPPGKYLSLPGGEDIIEQMQAAKTRVIETQSRFIRALDKHKALLQIRERMLGELLYLETNKEQLSGLNREMKGYHPSKHIDSLHEHLNRLHDIKVLYIYIYI